MLTATPVENRLDDLFQLVNLVRPGHLGTPKQFRVRYGSTSTSAEPARNLTTLQARLREVMVRHRRSELASMLPRRLAETLCVQPGTEEAELYALVSERVRLRHREVPDRPAGRWNGRLGQPDRPYQPQREPRILGLRDLRAAGGLNEAPAL